MSATFFQMVHPKKLHVCMCAHVHVQREREREMNRKQMWQMLAIVESKWTVYEWFVALFFQLFCTFKIFKNKFLRKYLAVKKKLTSGKTRNSFIANQSCYCNGGTSMCLSAPTGMSGAVTSFTLDPVKVRMWQ